MRITLLITAVVAANVDAQRSLTVTPQRPEPGAIVVLTLRDSAAGSDSGVSISGELAGEPLHFRLASSGTWHAIGAVPVDATDSLVARAVIARAEAVDSVTASVSVPPARVATRSRLSVSSQYTRPLDARTAARVTRENARAREVGRRSHETPRQWAEPFQRPRSSELTSEFGSGRLFNGRVTSRHLGVDFRGALGDTVRVANRGVVALVDTFFLAGTVVYVDHGEGVVTGYFHLSRPLVGVGDTVRRGDVIGLVGQSGRVTGPHLHWSARYGRITVNPMDLLTVGAGSAGDTAPSTSDPPLQRTPASSSPAPR